MLLSDPTGGAEKGAEREHASAHPSSPPHPLPSHLHLGGHGTAATGYAHPAAGCRAAPRLSQARRRGVLPPGARGFFWVGWDCYSWG
eukprot:2229807-Pyramimonas_sp.AAC.1